VFELFTLKNIRSALAFLQRTPFHPQWHAFEYAHQRLSLVRESGRGRVLDVGCGKKLSDEDFMTPAEYIGLDYDWGAEGLYDYAPNVLADAHSLPFASGSMNTVLLLEVLEHLKDPEVALKEAFRVLKPDGKLLLSAPFLYPVHDEPHDYRRWTMYGLELLVQQAGGEVEVRLLGGGGGKTVALMYSVAACKAVLMATSRKSYLRALLLMPFLCLIPIVNIASFLFSLGGSVSPFMAVGATCVCKKV